MMQTILTGLIAYAGVILVILVALWIAFHFLRGFAEGVRQDRYPRLRVRWNDDEDDDLPEDS